jgi:hypothetical protein
MVGSVDGLPLLWRKRGVPISKEENINNNKDNGNVIRKMKEGNNIQKK